ncbi:MAG: endonuclease domain-containing protein [Candidatus Moranbacteria bacterium]|nr:endonuclease domain-containing protein [Candidatus Moranbacteria bacterium]
MRRINNLKRLKSTRKKLRIASTVQEVILWSRLRRSQLGCKFRRQHSFNRYIVDFYCPESKLVVELDGWQHKEESQKRYDNKRSRYLKELGLTVLRFWNNDTNDNVEGVILKIEENLK